MIRLPQPRAFLEGEHMRHCVLTEPKENMERCKPGNTPYNSFTKNQGLKGTCSPNDSHLLALKLEEMLHLLPRKSSVTVGNKGEWNPSGKTRWGRWEEVKGGTRAARCESLQVHTIFRVDLQLRPIQYQRYA